MNDEYIINYFFGKGNNFIKRNNLIKYDDNIKNYLLNRFNDCEDIFESIIRIKYNIEIRPVCPICGKPVKFIGKQSKLYQTYCCRSCLSKGNVLKINKKYGTNCTLTLKEVKEKSKETLYNKYGVDHNWKIEEIHKKCIKKTYDLYGKEYLNNKRKESYINHYGVGHIMKLDKYKKNISDKSYMKLNDINKIQLAQKKRYKTLKKNNTFNKSNIEESIIEYLNKNNINYISQYKSELYPFNCDFYFPNKDLYVEIQGIWTHGGKPYEGTEEDISKLEYWKSKNTKFYSNAIKTWTIYDVYKRNIAKQNNLNYLEIFSIDFDYCIEKIMEKLNK